MSAPQIVCCLCAASCSAYSPVCNECVAASLRGIPPIGTPDPIAADEAEHGLCALPELTAEQMAEGNEYQKDCR